MFHNLWCFLFHRSAHQLFPVSPSSTMNRYCPKCIRAWTVK